MSNHLVAATTAAGNSSNNSGRGPFASALRNLAKQADIKDDESVEQCPNPAPVQSGNNSAG